MRFKVLLMAITIFWGSLHASFLTVSENKLLDSSGKEVRLTGLNWFGLETGNLAPHGLWSRDWYGMLKQVKSMGFNSIRIPFCDKIHDPSASATGISYSGKDPYRQNTDGKINQELVNKSPLEILDIIIQGCKQLGLKVILDNHSRSPDGYLEEKLWYNDEIPEEKWISNWEKLAQRYLGNNTVVGFDLNNEPHGSGDGSEWGSGNEARDWKQAAQKCGNRILKINPDVLIIVEGVEQFEGSSYWWGGNLKGVESFPVELTKPEKLLYSAHEYGPEVFQQTWFSDSQFPSQMTQIWDNHFGFIYNQGTGHVLIGEFGIKDDQAFDGKSGQWFDHFLNYMGSKYSWTFWCLNPNSGDTGGILQDDWQTPQQWKLDKLRPHLAPLIEATTSANQPTTKHSISTTQKQKTYLIDGKELQMNELDTQLLNFR